MQRIGLQREGQKQETNQEPNILGLVGDDDIAIYCNGKDQGRRKFSIAEEEINQDVKFRWLNAIGVECPCSLLRTREEVRMFIEIQESLIQSKNFWRMFQAWEVVCHSQEATNLDLCFSLVVSFLLKCDVSESSCHFLSHLH